jgi:predicted PurR-regulated permease PerM
MDSNKNNHDPKDLIEAWLPHILIFALLIGSVVLLWRILGPVMPSLLMSAALTSLTMPVYYHPVHKYLKNKFPQIPDSLLRKGCSFIAMILLALSILIPIILLIYSLTGTLRGADDVINSLLTKNITPFLSSLNDKLVTQVKVLKELYPTLPIEPQMVSEYISEKVLGFMDLHSSLMSFLFKGTGSLAAQVVLSIIAMVFFYAEGANIVRGVLKATPLENKETELLITTFRRVVLRLLTDSIAISILNGIILGTVVGLFTGFNVMILIFVSSFICLLPMIGSTIIWFPAFMFLLNKGEVGSAVSLALICVGSIVFVSWLRKKKVTKLYEHSSVTSFLLFMSVIGGVITFGFKGLLLGPMSVVLVNVLGVYWHSIYKRSKV